MRETNTAAERETFDRRLAFAIAFACITLPLAFLWGRGGGAIPGFEFSDFRLYFLPQRAFLSRWILRGVLPLWNPHLFCGYPTIEIQQSALFYALTIPSLLVRSPEAGLLFALSMHVALTIGSTWIALRHCCGVSRAAAATGAASYVMSGCFSERYLAGHLTIIYAITWLPLAILAFAKWAGVLGAKWRAEAPFRDVRTTTIVAVSTRDSFRRRWLLISLIASTCMVLSGAVQFAVYVFYAQAICTILPSTIRMRVRIPALAGMWIIVAALTAPQWLPTLGYLPYAARTSGAYAGFSYSGTELLAFLLEALFPQPFGRSTDTARFNPAASWETNSYCGIAVLIVALSACSFRARHHSNQPRVAITRLAACLLLMSIWFILGGPTPGASFFRNPARSLALPSLAVSLMVSAGFDQLCSPSFQESKTQRHRIAVASSAVALVALVLCVAARFFPLETAGFYTYLAHLNAFSGGATRKLVEGLKSDPSTAVLCASRALLITAVFCGALAICCAIYPKLSARVRAPLMAAILLADPTIAHLPNYLSGRFPARSDLPGPILRQLESEIRTRKNVSSLPARCAVSDTWTNSSQYHDQIFEAGGYDPLMPLFAVARRPRPSPEHRNNAEYARRISYAATGVQYIISQTPDDKTSVTELILPGKNDNTNSIAEFVNDIIGFDDVGFGPLDGKTNYVSTDDLEQTRKFLTATPGISGKPQQPTGTLKFDWSRAPHELKFLIDTPAPALLIAKITWLPGWRSYIDGAEPREVVPVRANGWQTAVPVRPGDRTVTLTYCPKYFLPSFVLSATGLLLIPVLLYGLKKMQRTARRQNFQQTATLREGQ